MGDVLILCEILIKLHVAPNLASMIDFVNVKLRRSDSSQVKMSQSPRSVID